MAKLEMPNVLRPAMGPGVALVGDAGLAADPLWGVGIGWALQSAEWLAESTAGAALGEDELGRALQRYRRRRNQSFLGHYLQIAGYSGARRFNPFERLMLAAGTIDPESARRFHAFTARSSFGSVLAPPALGRAVSVVIANRASLLTAGCQGRRPFRPARLIGPCVIRPPAPLRPDELAAAEAIPPRYQVD